MNAEVANRSGMGLGLLGPLGLTSLVAVILCFVPLFNLLDYEFSFALGLVAVPAALWWGCVLAARSVQGGSTPGASHLGVLAEVTSSLLLLAPPLFFITLNAVRVQNCNYLRGLAFFMLLPVLSTLCGAAWGALIGRLFRGWGLRLLALVVVVAVTLALIGQRLWSEPGVTVYDHLFGWFSGSLYDESVSIRQPLVLFRLATLLRIGLLVSLAALVHGLRRAGPLALPAIALVVLAVASVLWRAGSDRWGYDIRRDLILARSLTRTLTRPHAVLHLPPDADHALAEQVADEVEFQVNDLCRLLERPPPATPIAVFLYRDSLQKADLIGARDTMIARPWQQELHIHGLQLPHPVLRHELVHVLAAPFGAAPLGLTARFWVLPTAGVFEGLAEALDVPGEALSLHHGARAILSRPGAPDVAWLFSPFAFWRDSSSQAYTLSGSFILWLVEQRGMPALQRLYQRADFAGVYGQPLPELLAAWRSFVLGLTPPSRLEIRAGQSSFRRPSLFGRTCAHELVLLREAAQAAEDPDQAIDLMQRVVAYEGFSTTARVELAALLYRHQRFDDFMTTADALLASQELTPREAASLHERRGQILWRRGDVTGAQGALQQALDLSASPASRRLQTVRLWALAQNDPALRDFIMTFVNEEHGPRGGVMRLKEHYDRLRGDPMLAYLLGRQLFLERDWDYALKYLDRNLHLPIPELQSELMHMITVALFNSKQTERCVQAARGWAALAPYDGERERAELWARRCAFAGKLPLGSR